MKRVFSSPDLEQVDAIVDLLEDKGIKSTVLNEDCDRLPFGGNSVTWPSVWVMENAKTKEAVEIIAEFEEKNGQKSESEKTCEYPSWTCTKCGEKNDGVYSACWKCGEQLEN